MAIDIVEITIRIEEHLVALVDPDLRLGLPLKKHRQTNINSIWRSKKENGSY